MIKYTILRRVNKTSGWSSKTYYVRFYDNRKLTYINTDQTSKNAADIKAREIISKIPIKVKVSEASVRHLSLKQYLINNEWLSNTENPLYKDFKSGLSQHSFQLRASSLKVRYLNKIFMELNDSLGEVLYFNISKDDIKSLKKAFLLMKWLIILEIQLSTHCLQFILIWLKMINISNPILLQLHKLKCLKL